MYALWKNLVFFSKKALSAKEVGKKVLTEHVKVDQFTTARLDYTTLNEAVVQATRKILPGKELLVGFGETY